MYNNTILPYYIYHYIDTENSIYLGLITSSLYDLSPILYKGWKLYGIFYAFNPTLRPIPESTKLFNLKIKNYFPYDIYSYKYLYDIYLFDDTDIYSVNFIAYNRYIPNTKELYFYELAGGIFPTFENKPPSEGNWKLLNISPIYVLKSENDNFVCDNGKCIPSPISQNFLQLNDNNSVLNINDCLKKCNKSLNILQIIQEKTREKYIKIHKNGFKLSPRVKMFASRERKIVTDL